MRNAVIFKFIAILLCAACLLVSIGAGFGIFMLIESNLYHATVQDLKLASLDRTVYTAARLVVKRYLTETAQSLPAEIVDRYLEDYYERYGFFEDIKGWYYIIRDGKGNVIAADVEKESVRDALVYEYVVNGMTYPVVIGYEFINPYTAQDPTNPTMSPESFMNNTFQDAEDGSEYLYLENWGYEDRIGIHQYQLGICEAPVYAVTLYLMPDTYFLEDGWLWEIVEFGYANRYNIIWVLGASLLLFAALFTYLCCAAGRKPKREEVCPGGLNRLPLDLYAVLAGGAVCGILILGWEFLENYFDWYDPQWMLVPAAAAMTFVACLIAVAFLFGCAAQFKMKGFYWAKHSLIGMVLVVAIKLLSWLLRKLGRGGKWLFTKLLPVGKKFFRVLKDILVALWELVIKIWKTFWSLLASFLRFLWYTLRRFSQLLPVTWQWLLVGFGMIFVMLMCAGGHNPGFMVFGMALCVCIVMYGAHCFGVLLESTKRMSKGDLDTKVDDKLLLGSFQEYATHLNALADVAVEAAKQQIKSERMKAELVTNVSHDIKTPLTNIINYVDLLQKAESHEQAEQYLEVLDRQSQRLKKLIEDLMEMSKASTGNMAVDLMQVNAVEAINQALGEFSEKLEKAQLIPVFNPPQEPVMMMADGRLTWRVLSNLLGNAVKYALPGTRLYIDLVAVNGQVLISLKNISKEQLNVSSDELMERFVRGDASRNTEGSGLGLNIAKSLMELQKGQLHLLVDGDLFKVTLVFPEN